MDRNERARQEHMSGQARAARKAFEQAYAGGTVHVKDRHNRNMRVGDLVEFTPDRPLVFQVDQMTPVLDPRMPPGLIHVVMSCTVPITWEHGVPGKDILIIGHSEGGHASLDSSDRPADAADTVPPVADQPLQPIDAHGADERNAGDPGEPPPTFVTKPEDDPNGGSNEGGVH